MFPQFMSVIKEGVRNNILELCYIYPNHTTLRVSLITGHAISLYY